MGSSLTNKPKSYVFFFFFFLSNLIPINAAMSVVVGDGCGGVCGGNLLRYRSSSEIRTEIMEVNQNKV